ncbi:MAG: hypothetical protein ACI4UE_02740 [Candidatus Scatovivens sp.]
MNEENNIQPINNLEDLMQKQIKDIEDFKLKSKLIKLNDYPSFIQNVFKRLGKLPNDQVTPYELGKLASIILEQEKKISLLGGKTSKHHNEITNYMVNTSQNPFSKFINSIKNKFKNAVTQTTYEMTLEEIEKVAGRHLELFNRAGLNPIKPTHTLNFEKTNKNTNFPDSLTNQSSNVIHSNNKLAKYTIKDIVTPSKIPTPSTNNVTALDKDNDERI